MGQTDATRPVATPAPPAGHAPSRVVAAGRWRPGGVDATSRAVPEETAVALTYGRATHAVMLATPADLADFAVGFSLNEGIVGSAAEIEELDIVAAADGIELRMSIAGERMDRLLARRRMLRGATGCGLCGLESLAEAVRPPPAVPAGGAYDAAVLAALPAALARMQRLNHATHATHAAGFWSAERGLCLVREDVGRHNALDKLAGGLARAGIAAAPGAIVLTSRVSVEMVQKAARIGAPLLVAVSAPTALAVRAAEAAGMTLVAVARDDGFEAFTHVRRLGAAWLSQA